MNNNEILSSIRYTFDFNDDRMMALFKLGGRDASRAEVSDWLKKAGHVDFKVLKDLELAIFLNGFITHKRGSKDGKVAIPETELDNNIILRKLKIALSLKVEEMVEIFQLVGIQISKHELNAFFRKPGQNQYRKCLDQFLRNFLFGIKTKYRKPE